MKRFFLVLSLAVLVLVPACVQISPLPDDDGDAADGAKRERITQEQIDADEFSIPELIFKGRNLVLRNWKVQDGFGNGLGRAAPNINRLPGPDSTSCMSCHGLGNGVVLGWGSNASNVLVALDDPENPTIGGSNERNTPTVHGLVLLELLAKEISTDLQALRDEGIAEAVASGVEVTKALTSKGISYGAVTAQPDGSVDTSGVVGTDLDLRVRPFHAKGHEATIRIFTRGALNRHHGIQSTEFLMIQDAERDPETWDADQDGVVNELTEGELTAMTLFQVCMPIPQEVDQERESIASGRALMETIGCTQCHKPALMLNDPTWRFTSSNGVTLSADLTDSELLGAGRPTRETDGAVMVALWADLKRHDLGPESHEPLDQPVDLSMPNHESGTIAALIDDDLPPIPKELMLTTELWGVRDTGPWWHDGSSATIEDAILRHGGEAADAHDAYLALSAEDQGDLLAFLNSLQVAAVGEILVASDPNANAKVRLNSIDGAK